TGIASPTDTGLVEQFQQFTGAVGTTNDLFPIDVGGAALPTITARREFATATLDDGRVFIIGGRSGAGFGTLVSAADAVVEFNPRTNVLVARNFQGFTIRHSLRA